MSSVTEVPDINNPDLPDVVETARRSGVWDLLRRALTRFRYADGFSYARAVAFQLVLTLIPGAMFVVGLAAWMGDGRLQSILRAMAESLAPGPAGQIVLRVFEQGTDAVSTGNVAAVVGGALAMLTSGVTAMAQLQRGSSRIYGIQEDRPTLQRYGLATLLTLSAGVLFTVAFVVIALGSGITGSFGEGNPQSAWVTLRWPLGIALLPAAFALLYKVAPNRKQPSPLALGLGSVIAIIAWFVVSALLSFYLNASTAFGETYGPLAGVIGLMFWAQLSAIATFYGLAVNAQIEAEHAGVEEVRTSAQRSDEDSMETADPQYPFDPEALRKRLEFPR